MVNRELRVELPSDLVADLESRVVSQEFESLAQAVQVALRYYMDRHTQEQMAAYVQEEIKAGLNDPS
jgi:Arc/MetJ-type ribon-helix-helix transcriptional regulator